MKTFAMLLAMLCASCAASCGPAPTPQPPPVNPEPKPDPYGQTVCDRFCALLDSLNCPGENGSPGQDEVRGNADDVPCTRVCEDTLSQGVYRADVSCLDRASTCAAAEVCLLGE